jgi:NAD(P)-dependent dehydrogenase (short-subunit alcohol dehydrogenase family)
MSFKDKSIIITGASGGIGRETARLFAEKARPLDLVLLGHSIRNRTRIKQLFDWQPKIQKLLRKQAFWNGRGCFVL